MGKETIIGILGAMAEEVSGIVALLTKKQEHTIGMRTYYEGKINGVKAIVVFSRWGKVAAATTVSTLILKFKVSEIIFTGVAGAISSELNIGDIVIGKRLIQHDLDGRPLLQQYEIPLLHMTYISAEEHQISNAKQAVEKLLDMRTFHTIISADTLKALNIFHPHLVIGDIASGDQFFGKTSAKNDLLNRLPTTLCVEMEGAAVAQVCYEYKIPFTIIRTISDSADEKSHTDFAVFLEKVFYTYSIEIIKNIFEQK
ncbi:MAG: 5'-methylthioadenosine/adenosylhomocysteine nucleosidase [Bacteroidales bacterium]|jgi:adenosylhomocysteine nucleosidase|nr:5'-methylthioadenosine/adenosylhomocysteine nucleosidase [Bacteroidales bacterium]